MEPKLVEELKGLDFGRSSMGLKEYGVVAVLLLAIVGGALYWFSGVMEAASRKREEALTRQLYALNVKIDAAAVEARVRQKAIEDLLNKKVPEIKRETDARLGAIKGLSIEKQVEAWNK